MRRPDPREAKAAVASLGYQAGWGAVRWLPEAAAYRGFDAIADKSYRRNGKGVRRLRGNLARVLRLDPATSGDPGLEDVVRAGMRSYLRYWCDAFRLPDWDPELVRRRIRVVGEDNLRSHLEAGQGVIAALPHMGNWDHAGAWACLSDAPVSAVAERLEPEAVYRKFRSFREALGMDILPLTGGAGELMTSLADRVDAVRLVALLADRDLTASGIVVDMLGAKAKVPVGPAVLALRTGAPLLPVTSWYEGTAPHHRTVLRFHEPVPTPLGVARVDRPRAMMQSVADVFSEAIEAHPEDWHMLQRVFVDDLDPGR